MNLFDDTEVIVNRKIPYKLSKLSALELLKDIPESLKVVIRGLLKDNWKIYVVDQRRGWCSYRNKLITLPEWAMTHKDWTFKVWYVAHECAHTMAIGDVHGPEFMAALQKICPENCIHHELGYKPRNAKAAGIGQVKMIL